MPETVTPKRRVLVIDDSPDIRGVIKTVLEDEGYEVEEAEDGQHALAVVRTFAPHAIVCDLMMPNLDGAGFIAAYRGGPPPHVPIIVASASSKSLGVPVPEDADAYIDKPFEITALLAALDRVLEAG